MKNSKSITVNRKRPAPAGIKPGLSITIGVALITLSLVGAAVAQPQTRGSGTARQSQTRGSGPVPQSQGKPALPLGSVCPVCLVQMGKVIQGDPQYQSTRDGRTYLFVGSDQKEMFERNPEKYIPAFHGNCTVCKVEMGEIVPGKPEIFTVYKNRLFLFATPEQKKMFETNPAKYFGATLAAGGQCVVCLAGKAQVTGKPDFTAWYDGMRYQFPSEEQLNTFRDNPAKYVPAADGECLVCRVEMGKRVMGSPDSAALYNDKLYFFVGEDQLSMFKSDPEKYLKAEAEGNAKSAEGAGSGISAKPLQSEAASAPGSASTRKPNAGAKQPSQYNQTPSRPGNRTRPRAGGSGSSR